MNKLSAKERDKLVKPFFEALKEEISENWDIDEDIDLANFDLGEIKIELRGVLNYTPEEIIKANGSFYTSPGTSINDLWISFFPNRDSLQEDYDSGEKDTTNIWHKTISKIVKVLILENKSGSKSKSATKDKFTTRIADKALKVHRASNVRTLADQVLKTFQEPVAQIAINLLPEASRPALAGLAMDFFQTPEGAAVSKLALSMLLAYVPMGEGLDELKEEVAEELQITAATTLKVKVADKLTGPLREQFALAAGKSAAALPGAIASVPRKLRGKGKSEDIKELPAS